MTVLLDVAGRRRSPATMHGFHAARPPRIRGLRRSEVFWVGSRSVRAPSAATLPGAAPVGGEFARRGPGRSVAWAGRGPCLARLRRRPVRRAR
jgi:hypothetical protein